MPPEPVSRRRQPQRLPPPLMHGPEPIEGTAILADFPDDLGLLLWKTVRAVRLWTGLPATERAHAFQDDAHAARKAWLADAPEELRDALERAAAILQPRARSASVARACREIGEWAVARGNLPTAIEFMQAAAVALPADGEVAHEVARLARQAGDYTRAETWYRQAVSRARRASAWYEFTRAYIGLGAVFALRGNYPAARKSLIRGLRAARRFSIRSLAATAYHELMLLAIATGRTEDVTRLARSALQAYGPGNERAAALALDLGRYFLEVGRHTEALRLLRSNPADSGSPEERFSRAAATALAAALAGDPGAYEAASEPAESLLRGSAPGAMPRPAVRELVGAAETVGQPDRAAAIITVTGAYEAEPEGEPEAEAVAAPTAGEGGEGAAQHKPEVQLLALIEEFEALGRTRARN